MASLVYVSTSGDGHVCTSIKLGDPWFDEPTLSGVKKFGIGGKGDGYVHKWKCMLRAEAFKRFGECRRSAACSVRRMHRGRSVHVE